ncbi:hypothetical protein [Luteibacter sp.]|uniref:hypothetical protein n=1 Tax=Luteibacter sp. TaxID=1886636 RepID=UPI0028092304|nr:hypothetical protein [Luteibacter sp.]MDQ8050712.1 hypothetical protein [Luteibacter sp.]
MIHPVCNCCLKPLSADEMEFLGFRCEACEQDVNDRVEAWRAGASDPELDLIYNRLETVH